ncbi:Probable E3 ubiquitin-protein ligase sinah, partial [Gryllus bimaculatus]
IGAVAARVRARPDRVSLLLWNAGADPNCTPESLCCGPMPTNLQRLSACVAAVVAALECPVCLEVVAPPAHQCANGHLICVRCRVRSERCPVCRVRFSRGRSLLADHCFQALTDAFNLKSEAEEARPAKLRERLFGHRRKAKPPPAPAPPPKAALPVPPTNKFLARLLGRASSVENLSTAGRPPHGAAHAHEFNSLKAKSLSSSDISRPLSPAASRCPSHTALHLPPAHVLSPRSPLALRSRSRPASFHGSCDSLSGRIAADFGERPAAAAVAEGEVFVCPRSAGCGERLDTNTVVPHAHERHDGPLVHYARPSALWSLPPPLESATIALAAPDASATAVFVVVERVGDSDGGDGVADGDGQCDAPALYIIVFSMLIEIFSDEVISETIKIIALDAHLFILILKGSRRRKEDVFKIIIELFYCSKECLILKKYLDSQIFVCSVTLPDSAVSEEIKLSIYLFSKIPSSGEHGVHHYSISMFAFGRRLLHKCSLNCSEKSGNFSAQPGEKTPHNKVLGRGNVVYTYSRFPRNAITNMFNIAISKIRFSVVSSSINTKMIFKYSDYLLFLRSHHSLGTYYNTTRNNIFN